MNSAITWKDDIVFTLEKDHANKCWLSREQKTSLSIIKGKTRKGVLSATLAEFEKRGRNAVLSAIDSRLKEQENKRQLHSQSAKDRFMLYFNAEIEQFIGGWMDTFDIIKFDKWIRTPDGISTAQHLEQAYSKEASDFIRWLISL